VIPGGDSPPAADRTGAFDGVAIRPNRLDGAEEHPLGDELVVYVPPGETAYALNLSAVAIWQLCDGTRTVEEIAEELGPCVGSSGASLLPDVIQGVTRLHELGLLQLW
jgi:pyrroloquinoline quinone biosynthesis protein D